MYGDPLDHKRPLPLIMEQSRLKNLTFDDVEDEEERAELTKLAERMAEGIPFFEVEKKSSYLSTRVYNLSLSRCYDCKQLAVWIHNKLIYPIRGGAPEANPDLSPDVRRDYDEASSILDLSPRGAAALIRLAIQKLCKLVDPAGKDINDHIKNLVAKGLDLKIQRSLDVVRVIGNNAVHPGLIDLRDDRATAEMLFRLLNIIAEKMISEPKHVDEVYGKLPPEALAQIEKRDGKKQHERSDN